ncbi:hypothetical protein PAXINDRAFT_18076 [Paxillus involutus ATCC 200175]|uniref:Uncharacterized protein n=1 Tax=Paxillus involutus ATCC 200175 TaxID=664439 RepID=A0A0C9SZP8_PAXIN|nr:hypothetical protein PAXINDRAFT_18076 [Paxillus involutus ATCC 200175]
MPIHRTPRSSINQKAPRTVSSLKIQPQSRTPKVHTFVVQGDSGPSPIENGAEVTPKPKIEQRKSEWEGLDETPEWDHSSTSLDARADLLIADTLGRESDSDDEPPTSQQEASLILEASVARRKVRHAEKALARCIMVKHEVLGRLYNLQATQAERRFEDAQLSVGKIRNSMRQSGLPIVVHTLATGARKPYKRPRTVQGGGSYPISK